MEHFSLHLENHKVQFSSEIEEGTKHNTHVQERSPKTRGQLDCLETQSTTTLRNVQRKEGRGREKVVGGGREEGFYAQEEETIAEAWDVREATRAKQDMGID